MPGRYFDLMVVAAAAIWKERVEDIRTSTRAPCVRARTEIARLAYARGYSIDHLLGGFRWDKLREGWRSSEVIVRHLKYRTLDIYGERCAFLEVKESEIWEEGQQREARVSTSSLNTTVRLGYRLL